MKGSSTLAKKQIKPKKRFAFTCDEDDRLRGLVSKYGEDNWAIIASKMKKRSTRQCRDRWINYLSPLAINGTWTPEEDQLLKEKVETYGRKWKFLTNFFFGRTDINIKNHYNFLQKKLSKELLKQQQTNQQKPNTKNLKPEQNRANNFHNDHIELAAEIILNSNDQFKIKETVDMPNASEGVSANATSNSEDESSDVNFENKLMEDFINDLTIQLPGPNELMIDYYDLFL